MAPLAVVSTRSSRVNRSMMHTRPPARPHLCSYKRDELTCLRMPVHARRTTITAVASHLTMAGHLRSTTAPTNNCTSSITFHGCSRAQPTTTSAAACWRPLEPLLKHRRHLCHRRQIASASFVVNRHHCCILHVPVKLPSPVIPLDHHSPPATRSEWSKAAIAIELPTPAILRPYLPPQSTRCESCTISLASPARLHLQLTGFCPAIAAGEARAVLVTSQIVLGFPL